METYPTVKGQIVIPAELRRKYKITEKTRIVIVDNGDEIILRPMTPDAIKKLRGVLKGSGALQILMEERKKDRKKGK